MGKSVVLIGNASTSLIGPSSAEHAAEEFFNNRAFAGVFAPRPPLERWSPEQRKRFEAELARLERQARSDSEAAVKFAADVPLRGL